MRLRCPCCFAEYSAEMALDNDAARELMALLLNLERDLSRSLAAYLGLFRSKTRALAWERALRIAREVLELGNAQLLAPALSETVETMRAKQQSEAWRPLTNHNYLKRVMETVATRPAASAVDVVPAAHVQQGAAPAPSKTAQAVARLLTRKQ